MKSRLLTCASLAFLALPAYPQSATLQGPVAGFVYHRGSRTVRPLVGIPGSAYSGSPILNDVDAAWVAPGGNWALVTRDGHSALVPLSGLVPGEPSTAGLLDAADRVVWSRDGGTALLYSSTANRLQRVRVSPGEPAVDQPLDLSPWGAAATLAIEPAGNTIAFGVAGAGLFVFKAGQSPARFSDMAQPAATAFDESGRLYAVDGASQRLFQFDPGSGGFEFAALSEPGGPAVDAAGLAVSAGGRYLMLADRAGRVVRVYDTASHTLTNTISLDFAPTRMEALSASPVFLLNGDAANEWLLLLDARNMPSTYFVPASTEDRP